MSLVYNVQNLRSQEVSGVVTNSSTTKTERAAATAYLQQSGGVEPNSLIYIGIGILALLAFVFYRRFKRKSKRDYYYVEATSVNDPLVLIIVLGLVAMEAILIMNIPKYLPSLFQLNYAPAHPNLMPIITAVGLLAAIAGSILGVFILLRPRKPFDVLTQPAASDPAQNVEEFKEIIDETRYLLETGSDFRSTIIRCYKALCTLLDKSGVLQQASLTPREFEKKTIAKLGIRDSVHQLTTLFEKARYSSEIVSSYEAKNAQECLGRLSLELGGLEGDLSQDATSGKTR